jgi:hypothetical protein
MREEHPAFYEAYTTLPQFKEWLAEDVFQRTYQDYLTEKRDVVTLHADDPNAPEWVRATGDVTITHEGNTVTSDSGSESESEKTYVEFDLEFPDGQAGEAEKKPAKKEIAVGSGGVQLSIETGAMPSIASTRKPVTVSLRDITFQRNTAFPFSAAKASSLCTAFWNRPKNPYGEKHRMAKYLKSSLTSSQQSLSSPASISVSPTMN